MKLQRLLWKRTADGVQGRARHWSYCFHTIKAWLQQQGFSGGAVVKNLPVSTQDTRDKHSISGSGRFSGVGKGNPLQYSCLGNPMDRGAWWATVCGVTEPDTTEQQCSNNTAWELLCYCRDWRLKETNYAHTIGKPNPV